MVDQATVAVPTPPHGDVVREGLAERLARMIRLRTVSADLPETGPEPFRVFRALLAELYPLVHERLEREVVDGLGLLFRWRGRTDAAPLVLMGHYDTVPADVRDDWSRDPFGGEVAHGSVWGRGSLDDKGALCVLFEAVENLLASGFAPERDVYLVSAGDEEVAGSAAPSMAAVLRTRGITPWFVLDEGGAVVDGVLPTVDVLSAMVGVGEKGNLSVRITASGDVGHASSPSARPSAIDRIARAVTRARRVRFPARLNAPTRAMFTAYRRRASGPARVLPTVLSAVAPVSARVLALLGGELAATVRTTVVTTTLEAGTDENMLAPRASATLNLGVALGETVEQTLVRLRRGLRDPHLTYEVLSSREPSPESRTDNEQWQLVADAVEVAYPGALTVPYVALGGQDARHFHPSTPDATYRFAPLSMSAGQRESVHGVDEHVTVDALDRGERFYRALIRAVR